MMSSSSPFHINRKRTFRKGKSHKDNTMNHDTENFTEKKEEDISKSPHSRKHDLYSSGTVKKNTPSLKLCKKWLIGELKRVKKENLLLRSHLDTTDSTELVSIKQKLSQTLQKKCALRRKYKALLHIHKASLVELYNLAAAENDALRNDISLLGNVVQRLSAELDKYETEAVVQQKDPPLSVPSNKLIDNSHVAVKVSKLRSRQEVHIFAPLMAAYDSLLSERASLIAQYSSEARRLRSVFKSVEEENQELRRRVVACEATRVTDVHRVETLRANKELLEEQNEVLIQKVHLFNASLNLLLSKYERLEIRNLQLSRQNNSLVRAAELVKMRRSLQLPSEDSRGDYSQEPQEEPIAIVDPQNDNVDTNKTILQLKRQILLLQERNAILLKQNVEEHSECISKRVHENIVQYLQSMFDELTRKYRESNKRSVHGKEKLEDQMDNWVKIEEQKQSIEHQTQFKKSLEQQIQSKLLKQSKQNPNPDKNLEQSERMKAKKQSLEEQKQFKKFQQIESREVVEKRRSAAQQETTKKSEEQQMEQSDSYQGQGEHSRMSERQQLAEQSVKFGQSKKLEDDPLQMIKIQQQMFGVKTENNNKGEEKQKPSFKTEEHELEIHVQNQPKNFKENLQHTESSFFPKTKSVERPIHKEETSKHVEDNRDRIKANMRYLDQKDNLGEHQQQRRAEKQSKPINQEGQKAQPKKDDKEEQTPDVDVQQFLYSKTRF